MCPLPTITIVTPSYNQAQYLEQTICSVLSQRYPGLGYVLMDGGSTDGSLSIIGKYSARFAHWQSGQDGGQAAAIADGFNRHGGEILGWVNSDDYLLPGALRRVGRVFAQNAAVDWIVCGGIVVDESGRRIRKLYAMSQDFRSLLGGGQFFMQMSTFWRRSAYARIGGLDPSLKFCFDYDLFLRLAQKQRPVLLDAIAAAFRLHRESKSATIWDTVALPEIEQVRVRYGFGQWAEDEKEQVRSAVAAEFYRVTRSGIVRDAYRDPLYFWKCVLNKIRGRPGSALLGASAMGSKRDASKRHASAN